jgi:gliding motility-associated lipoprotein GldD
MMRLLFIALFISFLSCQEAEIYLPKPRIYPRINLPEKSITIFSQADCPFEMPYPDYFNYEKDALFNKEGAASDCWFDLYAPAINTYIYFSYIKIKNRKHFDALVEDAFELADKHNVKASFRDEILINRPEKNVHGVLFEINGPVATPIQFFMTDSTEHFLRGSLYFKARVNRDSIAPVYAFVKSDIDSLIQGIRWK